ncbi:MAG: transcriptional repressor [Candidatus Magasanikbacteria bacterium]|nr:transcriptional repressor [Candidatus Magasanikbacteria bacterium]
MPATAAHAALINDLRDKGERITAVRSVILAILSSQKYPLSANEFIAELKRKKLPVNKTTVYRQLSLLQFHEMVRPIRFADRTVRYEIATEDNHHHHLVCISCHKTGDVSFPEDLERQAKIIRQKNHFKVLRHSLEFFGLCRNCQKKKNP